MNFFKRLFAFKRFEANHKKVLKEMDTFIKNNTKTLELELDIVKNKISSINRLIVERQNSADKMGKEIVDINNKIGVRIVRRKFKGWTSEQEFIELSTRIYVMDNNNPKINAPFVKTDSKGVLDDYVNEIGAGSKMRCYMLTKLVLVGYGNLEEFVADGAEKEDFVYFFGKSYRELLAYMYEFNYEKRDEGISKLNFYEI